MSINEFNNTFESPMERKSRALNSFLANIEAEGFDTLQRKFNDKEGKQVIVMSFSILEAIPESIRSIVFPNGDRITLEVTNQDRMVPWDLDDLKKYAQKLEQGLKFVKPRSITPEY